MCTSGSESLKTDDLQWTFSFTFLYFCLEHLKVNICYVTMPMKRSSGGHGVYLIHSLTKTLCSSPEEIHTDFNGQTHFHQEDDSVLKSGKGATSVINVMLGFYCFITVRPRLYSLLQLHPLVPPMFRLKSEHLYNFLCFGSKHYQDTDWPHGGATATGLTDLRAGLLSSL